ncbi:PAS domain-containing protein [Telluribacter sp. SYSU D00476]|uniref:GAF domain-containing sensor histidine kinase n=1 Tax=Telluribacter sp. SYSU D00476 TaxID=2811430 RepID=UPI001FF269D7|nr:PAS domain-containing protein [Telluribacter sp. SYSU D00476]
MINTFGIDIIPENDAQRLEALYRYQLLDSPPEKSFTNLAHIIADVFDVPIALISLVDKERVHFKGNVGMPGIKNVDRGQSLCSLAVLSQEPTVISNTLADPCLLANPLVHGDFGLRFYAGAPLITPDGFNIGTVCIVDKKERTFTEREKERLVRFSKTVMHEIELRLASIQQAKVQDELYKTQIQLHAALAAGKVTTWHWDMVENCLSGSAELASLFGVDAQEAIKGLPLEIFIKSIFEEDRDYVTARIQRAIETGEEYEAEYRVVNSEGQQRWAIARGKVMYDCHQSPIGFTGILIDVTEKKQAEQEITDKNKELNSLYQELQFVTNTIPQLAWATDPDGTANFFNKVWYEYSGLTYDELKASGWTQLLHPEDYTSTLRAWQQARATGGIYEVEYRLKRHDGTYRWFLARGIPMKDSQDNIIKWYGTTTDIQDQKMVAEVLESRVEERTRELLEANNTLRRINAEQEQFTYISHHDLKEPIRKIQLFTDMIKADSSNTLSADSQKRLDRIAVASERMIAALKDVLDFASLNQEEQPEQVDLNEVIEAVKTDLEPVIAEKQATIQVATLPTIRAVPRQMHQLFYNLVSNALKFSKPDVAPEISITYQRFMPAEVHNHPELDSHREYYKIAIRDNGIGFDQQYQDKIFLMFQRLHSKDAYAGTGIGLALVRKVALKHGGKIWAESREGEGATFKVVLPA